MPEGWRWNPQKHPHQYRQNIFVIEPAKDEVAEDSSKRVHVVPFGFGVREPAPIDEWYGNPS